MKNAMSDETAALPPVAEMYQAVCDRNSQYEGLFFFAVRTTGIFCRPTCGARTPNPENVEFFRTAQDAVRAGFRPCKKCQPLEAPDATPPWLHELLHEVAAAPTRRWTDEDIRNVGVEPTRARRWFQRHHGMTFQAYLRTRRLAAAMEGLAVGQPMTKTAVGAGFESLSGFRDAFQKWSGKAPSAIQPAAASIHIHRMRTPLGPMLAAATKGRLCLLEFADRRELEQQLNRLRKIYQVPISPGENDILRQTERELAEYFAGQRQSFDVLLDIRGTEFQELVWRHLLQIPFGATCSYDRLARDIGRAGAQRAVGRANGDNRLALVIPCHRVIRSDGALSGYAGGLWRKRWLLDHERTLPAARPASSPGTPL